MSMRKLIVNPGLATCTLAFLTLTTGCKDSDDTSATARAATIISAKADYNKAIASANPNQQLEAVLSKLSSVSSNDDMGAASAMMEASIRMNLATSKLSEISIIEAENRGLRITVLGITSGSQQIEGVASGYSKFDNAAIISELDKSLGTCRTELEQANSTVANFEEPFNTFTSMNQRDRAVVNKLREQSGTHRETAFDLGDGQDSLLEIQQAIVLDRKADQLENDIETRSVALMGMRMQLNLSKTLAIKLQEQIESIKQAQAFLTRNKSDYTNTANTLRSTSGEALRQEYSDTHKAINTNTTGKLASLYSECESTLATAVAKCNSAASGSNRSSANVLKARLYQVKAQMHDMKYAVLDDHARMLNVLVNSQSGLGTASAFQSELGATNQAKDAEQQAAKEAYGNALDALNNVGGSLASDVAPLKAQLQQASDA